MAALPAYMRIRQYVNDLMIEHAQSDVRIMSERELCKKFDVTRPTARRALKELIDEGSLCAKPGFGTFINSGKVLNHTFTLRKSFKVMVIFGSGRYTDLDGLCMDTLARICDQFKFLPIRLRMVNLNQVDSDMALEELQMYNPDGIIWVRPGADSMDLIAAVRQCGVPVYIAGNIADGSKYHVTMDYYQCGRMAAAWFLERKRINVVFVGRTLESSIKSVIYDGWRDEFSAHGVQCEEHLQANMNCNIISRVKTILSNNSIDGIFTFGSEFTAVDIALTEMGADSKNCPLMLDENYFGLYGAKTTPSAKLIVFPPEISKLAADNLFKTLNKPDYEPDEIIMQPRIENMTE